MAAQIQARLTIHGPVCLGRKRIYATGGEGGISVYQQDDANHYRRIANASTVKGARTSFLLPDSSELFVASRAQASEPAEIRVYSPQ